MSAKDWWHTLRRSNLVARGELGGVVEGVHRRRIGQVVLPVGNRALHRIINLQGFVLQPMTPRKLVNHSNGLVWHEVWLVRHACAYRAKYIMSFNSSLQQRQHCVYYIHALHKGIALAIRQCAKEHYVDCIRLVIAYLASDDGLYVKAKHWEHGQTSVLDLLRLQSTAAVLLSCNI